MKIIKKNLIKYYKKIMKLNLQIKTQIKIIKNYNNN